MRYSSVKTLVATLSITVTLLAAAPTAAARPTGPRGTQSTGAREIDPFGALRQLITRTLRRISANSGISIPVPKEEESTVQAPSDPTAPTPTEPVGGQ